MYRIRSFTQIQNEITDIYWDYTIQDSCFHPQNKYDYELCIGTALHNLVFTQIHIVITDFILKLRRLFVCSGKYALR